MNRPFLIMACAVGLVIAAVFFVLHRPDSPVPVSSSPINMPSPQELPHAQANRATLDDPRSSGSRGPDEIHAALSIEDPALRDTAVAKALTEWVTRDAAAATKFALHVTAGPLRDLSMRTVAQAWGALDPKQAGDWANTLPAGERESMLASICLSAAAQHPAESVEIADRMTPRDDTLIENIIAQWAGRDIKSAAAWVREEPVGEGRDRMTQRIALAQAQTDPAAAANLVIDQIPPGPEQTEAIITVVNQWARKNPQEAKAWVSQFPPGPVQQRAAQEIAGMEVK